MNVIQFVNEGLGNSSYLVELDNRTAIAVDPDRSVRRYLETIERRGLSLAGIFETHLHADFVSGARELSATFGAPIHAAAGAQLSFPYRGLAGGQVTELGGFQITALGSPGHTPEHLSYALRAASGPPVLFSGGALIVGGAARTDLISPALTEQLTRDEFRTLRNAFNTLPDETLLYPTHGGGSFCSTGAGGERSSTLGRERQANPLLSLNDEAEFVRWFPTTFPAVPDYFFRLRAFNQAGPRLVRDIAPPPALDADDFARAMPGAAVVDVRGKEDYARGHVPGSLNDTLRDVYPIWLGWLVPADARLLFLTDGMPLESVVEESLLVGYEDFGGYLHGGIDAWVASGRQVSSVELAGAPEARRRLIEGAIALDVRETSEFVAGHVEGAVHMPLGTIPAHNARIPRDRPIVVYCGHGERSSTAVSLLERAGFQQLVNLDGGIGAWQDAGYSIEG